ncbi:tape measure protein [Limosilactobacillus agrestis]|uniref:Tape measure protein n=1 Tax=Limosilactobacillus agrestis TaxID=2759748 RepID=A0ABS8R6X1_9LACO|nr:tape measure protein [Limosilactobacillus agrestis]
MSAVVEKEFVWKFIANVRQGVSEIKRAQNEVTEMVNDIKASKVDSIFNSSKIRESVNEVANAADKVKEQTNSLVSNVEETKNSVNEKISQVAKKQSDLAKEAIEKVRSKNAEIKQNIEQTTTDFMHQLSRIPREKATDLLAKIKDSNLGKFTRKLRDVPKIKETVVTIKDRFSNSLRNFNNQLKESQNSSLKLKDVLMGTFLGNAVLGGIRAVSNGIKGLAAAGMEFNTEQQKMQQTWLTLTDSKQAAQGMVDTINELSVKTGQSRDLVNELEQGFYHLHSSKEESDAMTKSMLNMGDAVGLTSDQMKQVEQDMVHGLATGKVTQGELNQIGMYFPMIDEAMAKHFNTTVKGMREMAHAGKISGEDLEKVFEELGSGKYEKAADNMMQSMWGMERTIKSQAPALIGAFEKPFFNAKSPIYKAVSKWVLDSDTQKKFNELGKVVNNGISKIMTVFAGKGNSTSDIENSLNRSFDSITNKVKTATDTIAKNANNIKQVFSIINSISSITFKSVRAAIMDVANIFGIFGSKSEKARSPLSAIAGLLRGIADNKAAIQALGVVMLSVFTVDKYIAFTKWLTELKKTMLFAETVSILKTLKTGFTSLASVGIKALGGLISGTKELTVANAALDIALSPITWIVTAVVALGVAFYEAYKHCKPFRDIVNKTGEAIKKLFTGKYDWEQSFGKGLSNLGKSFQKFAKKIPQFFKGVGKAIVKTIVIGLALPVGIGITLMKPLIKPLQNSTKSLVKTVQKQWQSFSKWLGKLFDPVAKLWNRVWNGWARIFSTVWNALKKTASSGMKAIERLISPAVKAIEKVWSTVWNAIASFFSGIWHTITSVGGSGMRMLHSAIAGPLNTISSIWHSVWNGISSFFKGIWDGIKQAAQNGMNGVINVINAGISAINKVWSFFTGHGTGVNKLGHVHFAQGGTVHRHLSVINDGDGPDWKELVQTPDGNLFMSQERNWTGFLPEGTRVYSGAETRQIMNAVGVSHYATGGIVGAQHFADGGIIGEGIDWAKGSLENIGSWLGDKFSALEDFLADPLKATKGLLEKATSGMYKGLGNFADVAHGAIDKLTQPISDWFKKGLEKLEAQFESGGASPDLIRAAAAKMHVAISGADISHIMNVIKHESGGNARAVNNWDVNAKNGDPSKGILQFISSTFRKYAVAGHTNIYSPFDQLLAMFNDTTWRSDLTLGGWGPTGGRRFATGGEVFGLTNAIIGDNPEHHEFVLNPYAVSAEPLLDRAFEATAQAQPASSSTGNGNSKLDQMIDLLGKVLVAIESQDTNVYLDGEKITDDTNKRNAKKWSLLKA